MKKRIFCLLAVLAVIFTLPAAVTAEETAAIPLAVKKSAESCVKINVKTNFGTEQLTGVTVGKGKDVKYVITVLSGVEGNTGNITAGTADEQNIKAALIALDKKSNLALLELSETIPNVKPARIREKESKDKEEIYTVGYSARKDIKNISKGNILSQNKLTSGEVSTDVYRITVNTDASLNGAMLVTKNGGLAGICVYDGNTDANKVITEKAVIQLLKNNNIKYKKSTMLYLIIILVLIAAGVIGGIFALIGLMKSKKEKMPRIVGIAGEFAGQAIPVKAEGINIGRDAKFCQVVILENSTVSRCHCNIRYDNIKHSFVLTDLSSTHGTYTNGEKLAANTPRYIGPQTVFYVGSEKNAFKTVEGGSEE